MKPNKRLEEIENFFKSDANYRVYASDTQWLISRVKTLTEVLMKVSEWSEFGGSSDWPEVISLVRKTITTEGEL